MPFLSLLLWQFNKKKSFFSEERLIFMAGENLNDTPAQETPPASENPNQSLETQTQQMSEEKKDFNVLNNKWEFEMMPMTIEEFVSNQSADISQLHSLLTNINSNPEFKGQLVNFAGKNQEIENDIQKLNEAYRALGKEEIPEEVLRIQTVKLSNAETAKEYISNVAERSRIEFGKQLEKYAQDRRQKIITGVNSLRENYPELNNNSSFKTQFLTLLKSGSGLETELLGAINGFNVGATSYFRNIKDTFDNFKRNADVLDNQLKCLNEFMSTDDFIQALSDQTGIPVDELEVPLKAALGEEGFKAVKNGTPNVSDVMNALRFASEGNKEERKKEFEAYRNKSPEEKEKDIKNMQKARSDAEGDPKSMEEKITGAENLLKEIRESFLSEEDSILDKVDSDVRDKLSEMLTFYEDQLSYIKQGLENYNNCPEEDKLSKYGLSLKDMDGNLNMIKSELIKFIKEGLQSKDGKTTWEFRSPRSLWWSIKGWKELITEQMQRIDKKSKTGWDETIGNVAGKVTSGALKKAFQIGSQRAQTESEAIDREEREKWKEWDQKDPPYMINLLKNFNGNDVQYFRALLEELSRKGLLRWDDPVIWRNFERFCGIKMPKAAYDNVPLRNATLDQMVIETFGDQGWFKQHLNEATSNLIGKYGERQKEFDAIDGRKDSAKEMSEILRIQYNNNKEAFDEGYGQMKDNPYYFSTKDEDSIKYAGLWVKTMDSGSCTDTERFFLLLRGIATGILPMEYLAHIEVDKMFFNERWPILNWFRDGKKRSDYLMYDKMITGGQANWNSSNREEYFFKGHTPTIERFLHNEMIFNKGNIDRDSRVLERYEKVDKDFGVAPSTSENVYKKYMGANGRQLRQNAGMMNDLAFWSGRLNYFSDFNVNGEELSNKDKEQNRKVLFDNMGGFVLADAMAKSRFDGGQATRLGDTEYDKNTPGMTQAGLLVKEFSAIVKNFLTEFMMKTNFQTNYEGVTQNKETVIKLLFSNDLHKKEIQEALGSDNQQKEKMNPTDERNKYIKKVGTGELQRHIEKNKDKFLTLLKKWQEVGAFASMDVANNAKVLGITNYNIDGSSVPESLRLDYNNIIQMPTSRRPSESYDNKLPLAA